MRRTAYWRYRSKRENRVESRDFDQHSRCSSCIGLLVARTRGTRYAGYAGGSLSMAISTRSRKELGSNRLILIGRQLFDEKSSVSFSESEMCKNLERTKEWFVRSLR